LGCLAAILACCSSLLRRPGVRLVRVRGGEGGTYDAAVWACGDELGGGEGEEGEEGEEEEGYVAEGHFCWMLDS